MVVCLFSLGERTWHTKHSMHKPWQVSYWEYIHRKHLYTKMDVTRRTHMFYTRSPWLSSPQRPHDSGLSQSSARFQHLDLTTLDRRRFRNRPRDVVCYVRDYHWKVVRLICSVQIKVESQCHCFVCLWSHVFMFVHAIVEAYFFDASKAAYCQYSSPSSPPSLSCLSSHTLLCSAALLLRASRVSIFPQNVENKFGITWFPLLYIVNAFSRTAMTALAFICVVIIIKV